MDSDEPFSMTFVTADRRRGTGGEIISVKNWVKASTPVEGVVNPSKKKRILSQLILAKNPNHYENKTRNIRNLRKLNEIRKVHIRLIISFNGKKVA